MRRAAQGNISATAEMQPARQVGEKISPLSDCRATQGSILVVAECSSRREIFGQHEK